MAKVITGDEVRADPFGGPNTRNQRSVAHRDRLVEIRCPAVRGRNGHRGAPFIVVRRDGTVHWPLGFSAEEEPGAYWTVCRCRSHHLISRRRLNEVTLLAWKHDRAEPLYVSVGELAPPHI